ncbi:MAG: serine hydrolase [Acidobacteriota bacterium]
MFRKALAAGALLLAAGLPASAESFRVTGARVADGTGRPLSKQDVRVEGDRIVEVGKLAPRKGETVIRGDGLVLAPGFIDVHNHSTGGLSTDPLAATQVSQGITTLVVGADGESPWPIADYLDARRKSPAAVNVLALVGHATVREMVMGKDFKRPATAAEAARMSQLVAQAMREGAVGLSSGLEYEVGSYSETPELVEMSRAAAAGGGFYMTHMRDEADKSFEALEEAIRIGREARIPLQISHIKLATVGVWGRARDFAARIEKAIASGQDILADCYPYEAWHANIEVLVPNKKYDDPASVERALADVGGPDRVTITECRKHPEFVSKNMEQIARELKITPVELFIRIVKDGGADIIGHSMKEDDVRVFYKSPWVMVASDGGIGSSHPRGAGTYPRVLGRYVRENHWFSLAEAIRKMTSLPARRLGLKDRGRIAAGMKADLVLFDPETIVDRSTFEDPGRLSEGVRVVWVNGQKVWNEGRTAGARPGEAISGKGTAAAAGSGASNAADAVDAVFSAYDRNDSPGCALAVVRDGRVVRARGYGMASLEHGVAITPDTVFDIGSVAKQFAAASIVLLSRDGKLSLDDPIRRHVPELPAWADPVTIRHLLHHTSGLRDYTNLLSLAGARSADVTTDREALEILSRQKGVDFPAGSGYRYSNTGYFLLSVVVERVSGRSLRDFARERIFRPLRMRSTEYMNDHRQIVPRRATGYSSRQEGGFRVAMSDWEQNGDGGLNTTVLDLARWDRNFEQPVVGGPEMLTEMLRPGVAAGKPIDYALGLRVGTDRGLRRVHHGGSWVGYRAEFLRYPEKRVSVFVLCNERDAQPGRLARSVAAVYLPELGQAEEAAAGAPPAGDAPPAPGAPGDAASWAGVYWSPSAFEVRRIRAADGRLLYQASGAEHPMVLRTPGRFGIAGSSIDLRLEAPAGGAVLTESYSESPDEKPSVWKRVAPSPAGADLSRYAGRYFSDELDAEYRIADEGGRLVLHRRGADPERLEPLFADAYQDPEVGVILFERDGSGAMTGLVIGAGPSRIPFARRRG